MANAGELQLSIVVPLFDEAESLPELVEWIARVMDANNFTYEVLLIDDGSKDNSWQVIGALRTRFPAVRGIRFRRNYGKSAALNVGFKQARGAVVITMDADLQDSPDEIPDLYRMVTAEGYHLVSGYKRKRHDPLMKTIPSKLFNYVTRLISGIKLHDFNCGLKAYQLRVVKSIEVYGEMHRYIPYIAKNAGYGHIGEKVVIHRARKYGYSKFGLERFVNGFLDLLTLYFVLKFGRKPMHFFGALGALFFLAGVGSSLFLIFEKLYKLHIVQEPPPEIRPVVDQPLFYLSLAVLVVGAQLFTAGYIGELLVRNAPGRDNYLIDETLGDA